jgi:hypothetical protein
MKQADPRQLSLPTPSYLEAAAGMPHLVPASSAELTELAIHRKLCELRAAQKPRNPKRGAKPKSVPKSRRKLGAKVELARRVKAR